MEICPNSTRGCYLRTVVAILIACFLLGSADAASAKCIPPFELEWGPVSGTELPPSPRIFAFVPRSRVGGEFTSRQAQLKVTKVAESEAFEVYELAILADTGYVVVQYDSGAGSQDAAGYEIGKRISNHAMVTGIEHAIGAWMCAGWDFIHLALEGNLVALRFDWHDWRESTIVPASRATVGHIGCTGPIAEIHELRTFDAVALYADGTEQRLGSSMLEGGGTPRLPVELAPHLRLDARPKRATRPAPTYEEELATFVEEPDHDRRALVAYSLLWILLVMARLPIQTVR